MFNSQKINNDPEPYIIDLGLALGTVRSSEDAGSHWDSHDTYYVPRPEFDNTPNPVLLKARSIPKENRVDWATAYLMQEVHRFNWPDWTDAHIDHATKVLTRLVNIYGTER